jgi:hypothetical protein
MSIVSTIYGDMDESELVKSESVNDTSTETVVATEYRKPGSDEIVHRSVHMTLKEMPVFAKAVAGE